MNWEVNGIQIEFDIEDAGTAERVEKALTEMGNTEFKNTNSLSEQIKIYCNTIKDMFSKVFGEYTTNTIFKDVKVNKRIYEDIYCSFLDCLDSQKSAMLKRSERLKKYSPKH